MRKIIIVILGVFALAGEIKSQGKYGTDSVKCVENLSLYGEYFKQENFDDAVAPWRWVFLHCPSSSSNIYVRGPQILKHLITKHPEKKDAYIDTLMMIFDKRIVYFGQEGYVLGLKGYELLGVDSKRSEEALTYMEKSLELDGNNASIQAVYGYISAIVNLEKEGKKTKKDVLEAYAKVSEIIDYNIINESKNTNNFIVYAEKVEDKFTPYANCSDLISLFETKFSPTTEDVNLLKRITKTLENKNCMDAELFFSASNRLHELEPSAQSASNMGKMSASKHKYSDAINYFKQAVDMEENTDLKAKYYIELADALRLSGSYSAARSAAYKAAELRPQWGEPYMIIGNIYIASAGECASSEFDKLSVYWAAVDKFNYAKSVDAALNEKANKAISTYSKYFPSKETCFFYNIKSGDTYTVKCWINENTRVRTVD